MRKTTRTFLLKFFVNIVNDRVIFKIFEIVLAYINKNVDKSKIYKLTLVTCKYILLYNYLLIE